MSPLGFVCSARKKAISVLAVSSLFCGLSAAQFLAPVPLGGTTDFSGAIAAPAITAPAALATARTAGITGLGEAAPSPAGADKASVAPNAPLPPLGTNQFASFVHDTTGRSLPLFGFNLFAGHSFASLTDVPVPADYVLGPGDDINIKLWGAIDQSFTLAIDRNGQITIPKVGPITVAGTHADKIEPLLRAHIGRVYSNFQLSATPGRLRSIQVYVVGQARKPGVYTVSSLSTLISALFESGGPAATGSMRQIQLVRSGQTISTIDLYKFIQSGDTSADARLLPGDVIVVPPAGPRVALSGALDNPAIYELSGKEETLAQLLAYSGGQQILTSLHKVLIERIDPDQGKAPRVIEERALTPAGLTSTVRDGDVVTLFKISPQYSNAVTLRGNVAAPLRYAYRPGMKVSDLIPEVGALIQADYYTRKNIMVQYESGKAVSADRVANEVKNLLEEINWDYAVIERLDPKEVRSLLIPFNLTKAIKDKDPANDLTLLPGDVVTIFGVNDLPVPMSKRTQYVRIGGEINRPGIYQIQPGETLPQLVQSAGGLSSNAYAYGLVFTRESTRAQQQANLDQSIRRMEADSNARSAALLQNLSEQDKSIAQMQSETQRLLLARLKGLKANGRIALEMDPEQPVLPAIALEDGDQITVPNKPSFVGVYGAVMAETSFIHRPEASVRDYLDRAGLSVGAEEDATLIVRADGSVESNQAARSLFASGSGFMSKRLQPGDSIFVPDKIDRRTAYTQFVQGAKDWTSILFQFGLGAAAIRTLRN